MLCFNLFWFSMLWVSLHTRQLVSFYTYLLAFATVPLSYLMNSFTVSYILASDPMVQLPFSLLSMFITTLLLLSSKTVAENWVSKKSWFVLILKPVHSWLSLYFLGKNFFVFQDTKLKFSRISWNLTKFQLNQTTNRNLKI